MKEDINKLEEAGEKLAKYLEENFHPHVTAIVTSTSIQLVEGIMTGKYSYKSDTEERKTSEEWQKLCSVHVLDPDGWDRKNFTYSWYEEKITRSEFEERMWKSTVSNVFPDKEKVWKDRELTPDGWNTKLYEVKYEDGEPCNHRGCKNHVYFKCEGCGRRGARGKVYTLKNIYEV